MVLARRCGPDHYLQALEGPDAMRSRFMYG
jgi:hypothetical protein